MKPPTANRTLTTVPFGLMWILAVLAAPRLCMANDGAVTGVGGSIHLLDGHPSIVLVGEHVHATLDPRDNVIEVECVFVLENRGPADSVLVGFPEIAAGDASSRPFLHFRSFVDAEEATCVRTEGVQDEAAHSKYWWTKRVFFAAGQTRVIRDAYGAEAGFAIGGPEGNLRFFTYTLSTGASWTGRIGAATVVFSLSPCGSPFRLASSTPEPAVSDSCEYRWSFSDFEPGTSAPHRIQVTWYE